MQKVLVFGQMREFLSTVIKSCRANFGVKWRVFFSTSIFVQKCQFWAQKIEIVWEMLTVHYYWVWICYWKTCLFSETKIWKKTSIFLRKCLFVFHLLENCYFDSKYHFIRWYFGQKCHFPSKIYISSGIYSFEKSSSFLRKGVNLVVNYGKSDNWFGVNFYKTLGIFCCKKK